MGITNAWVVPVSVEITSCRAPSCWAKFSTSFVPSHCVLWANGNTVSLEPFRQLALSPGETQEWSLAYEFGAVI